LKLPGLSRRVVHKRYEGKPDMQTLTLDETNKGFDLMHSGTSTRSVVVS